MDRKSYIADSFRKNMKFEATACQENLFNDVADFIAGDDGDILVVNGYAGTGKTTAIAAVITSMKEFKVPCILLAPTGRAAKVLASYSGSRASTIHKQIYRQKSVGEDGFGQFAMSPNRFKDALYIVDEVSLIGIDVYESQSTTTFGTGNLLEDLISYVRSGTGCRLILVGDSAQLPPVGLDKSPALSQEYMSFAGGVRFSTLTTVVRQKKQSGILYNATLLRNLISSDCFEETEPSELHLNFDDFDDVDRITGGEILERLSDAYDKYGEDETIILCRSNRRANRYNAGIRAQVQYKDERLVRDDRLMIVKNCYRFMDGVEGMDYIANGDMAKLVRISHYEDRYGLHFADATLIFPDYDNQEITAKVCLDTLESESASLTYEQQNMLYQGVLEDYSGLSTKKKRYNAVKEDPFYNALQLKYAEAITCHKSQGGQWKCVFIDNPFWQDMLTLDDLKWLYTAITRGVEKVYVVNFKDDFFET